MNDVDFPVGEGARRHRRGAAAGLTPVKVNMVVKRGMNDDDILEHGRHFRGTRHHPALHRVHGRRRDQRLALDDVVPPAEIVSAIDAAGRSSRSSRTTSARSPSASATATAAARSASSPRSRSRSAPPARAPGCRPTASSTPACSRAAATTCARSCAPALRRGARRASCAASGACAPTATQSCARGHAARPARVEMSHIGG